MMSNAEFGPRSKDRDGAGATPFRYPGGKAFLADLLQERIELASSKITTYAEPFAGGAGAAIELLARGAIQRIILNDYDRRIHAAWWAILNQTEEFVRKIESTTLDMETWHYYRDIVQSNRSDEDRFELGFATYFLNRTNHSGVIVGAGPIGGYGQTGRWLLNARWYPETMIRRVRWIGERRDSISLSNLDGIEFISRFKTMDSYETFFFIDPPYVQAGAKLYFNAMNDLKHLDLARYLTGPEAVPYWLLTYDDCHLIRNAYSKVRIEKIPVRYSLRRKRTAHEVCVIPV